MNHVNIISLLIIKIFIEKKPGLWIYLIILFTISLADNSSIIYAANCNVVITPDLPLISSNELIEDDINIILEKYYDAYLGTSTPSSSLLTNAISQYNNLDVVVDNGEISGNSIPSYTSVPFLRVFAQHLRFNPNDNVIREKANNTVWLVSKQICDGSLEVDRNTYEFEEFARPAAILCGYFDENIWSLFENAMHVHGVFRHLWEPLYDETYQITHGTINTDIMYNLGDVLLAYAANQKTADERYLWMRGYKRWLERFTSYTFGTADGIKIDGTGFHHWTAYDGYMYSFITACNVVYYTSGTEFQISEDNYLFLRNAIYAQIVMSNDDGVKALSLVGRNPQSRNINYSSKSVKNLALAGGQILGLSTADPIIAGEYNRIWGYTPDFNYASITPLSQSSGYYQFNHANTGIFRKDSWLAVMKGFTNSLWGSELYATSNRYGRYQSYGTLEMIYSGSLLEANGYDVETWNWNFNPGATTIVLPWELLHGEMARIDEYQEKSFAGALAFKNKNSETLNQTHGSVGMFAMDFIEKEGQGFSTYYGPNTHNSTFRFKKSTFVFDDMIICLGSDINNDDISHSTVTTLFQRRNTGNAIWGNGSTQRRTITFNGASNNWILSNYQTGFYLVEGNNDTQLWRNDTQQTPNQNQIDPSAFINNPIEKYWIGYIEHGKNPVDAEYEYIVIPQATTSILTNLHNKIEAGNKPYTVHQKNTVAHILEHHTGVWGYAFYEKNISINNAGKIVNVSEPCLVMYDEDEENETMKLAIVNPDMGFTPRSFQGSVERTINIILRGAWTLINTDPSMVNLTYNGQNTELSFITKDGLPIEIDLKQDVSAGIKNENNGNNTFKIYPNPSSDVIWLEGRFYKNCTWLITDSSGIKLDEGWVNGEKSTIDISFLASGIYFISIMDGQKGFSTKKLIVKP